ncbi:MAG: hypothetical protein Q7S29_04725 [Candidatus Peribacter sp.]|nr:hypothetical protein [Candidatus Peribacter sp.]
MKRFITGLQASETIGARCSAFRMRTKEFKIALEEVKTTRKDSYASNDKHVVIYCENLFIARKLLAHILDAFSVLHFEVIDTDRIDELIDNAPGQNDHRLLWKYSGSGILSVLRLFRTIHQNPILLYACAMFRQSLLLHSNSYMELDPNEYPYEQHSFRYRDHVRFAYAIIIAYEMIEEMGLAPNNRQQFWITENGQRRWLKNEVEKYLKKLNKLHVDGREDFLWSLRGKITALESFYFDNGVVKESEFRDVKHEIRDCYIPMYLAVIYLRQLRSKVFLHGKMHRRAKYCSIHEVFNAQSLARMLLLYVSRFDS